MECHVDWSEMAYGSEYRLIIVTTFRLRKAVQVWVND